MRDTFDEAWFYVMVQDVPDDETLSPAIEREALVRARSSWPLSLILAQYYQLRNDPRVDDLARQFADGAAAEPDTGRLAKFYDDVNDAAVDIMMHCRPHVEALIMPVLADRFLVDGAELRRRAQKKVERSVRSTKTGKDKVRT
ncbi:MAG: hypothetical protein H0V00_13600 [Chloroflexia bacterium]|nr:hypothetical protein [Chloroflexia bacterium]